VVFDAAQLGVLLDAASRLRHDLMPVQTWLSFEGRPPDIDALWSRDVRIFGLAHAWHNDLAGAATDPRPRATRGLTAKGRQVAAQILERGGLIDVSHLDADSFFDVARLAKEHGDAPLIATHSGVSALANHRRNLSDAQLRAIARSGGGTGLVGVTLHGPHLRAAGQASSQDWARAVWHVVETVGPGHAALGSDFDGAIMTPQDVRDTRDLLKLRSALGKLANAGVVGAVMSGNARRLLRERIDARTDAAGFAKIAPGASLPSR
jgi:membrane dipeptidase